MSVEWRQIRELSFELGEYIERRACAVCSSALEKPAAYQKIFDELTKNDFLMLIPIEGHDEYAAVFKKVPDDYEAVMRGIANGQ